MPLRERDDDIYGGYAEKCIRVGVTTILDDQCLQDRVLGATESDVLSQGSGFRYFLLCLKQKRGGFADQRRRAAEERGRLVLNLKKRLRYASPDAVCGDLAV